MIIDLNIQEVKLLETLVSAELWHLNDVRADGYRLDVILGIDDEISNAKDLLHKLDTALGIAK